MKALRKPGKLARCVLSTLGVSLSLAATGCQVDIGGQTLPSPYWITDDVQYFPAGPEFKLAREAAAMKAAADDQARMGGPPAENMPPAVPMGPGGPGAPPGNL